MEKEGVARKIAQISKYWYYGICDRSGTRKG